MIVIYIGTGTDQHLNCPRCWWVVICHVTFGSLDTSSLVYIKVGGNCPLTSKNWTLPHGKAPPTRRLKEIIVQQLAKDNRDTKVFDVTDRSAAGEQTF